ncbi:MAG: hypothetical protein KIH62_004695 [Candidatus Kerfeldbacteria bacterium]|nr:hypothetical protein [Candidatus Kerfeldbacteria bacterium]
MPKHFTKEWSVNGFVVSFSTNGEFTIIGPNNHLYFGAPQYFVKPKDIQSVVSPHDGELKIDVCPDSRRVQLTTCIQGDVRTYRSQRMHNGIVKLRTVEELADLRTVSPQSVQLEGKTYTVRRSYGKYFYEHALRFPKGTEIKTTKHGCIAMLPVDAAQYTMISRTNDLCALSHIPKLKTIAPLQKRIPGFSSTEQKAIHTLLDTSMNEISLMLKWGKTSSDRFGTVFPRDWMETADISRAIFSKDSIDFLYSKALQYVTPQGEGWHEDVVGELRETHKKLGKQVVNRDMIDVEPHYLLGLSAISSSAFRRERKKMAAVAQRLYRMAQQRTLVTFKKITSHDRLHHDVFSAAELKGKTYLPRGNWRDIASSFGNANDAVAPFDVNAAFMPQALENALQAQLLSNTSEVRSVIRWWKSVQDLYRFSNQDGSMAFGLCRYGKKSALLTLNHLDESYYYFYREGTEQELLSFARRMKNPAYFYTSVGPVVTAFNNTIGLDTRSYHGTVIWPKQTAFALLALSKHITLGKQYGWSKDTVKELQAVLVDTVQKSVRAYVRMQHVPELYVCVKGKPVSFMAQQGTSEESSSVQLWSAIALHAMLFEYIKYSK